MISGRGLTRREFLTSAALGAGALGCGLHGAVAPAGSPSLTRPLRCVFYSDVHARVEWDTPQALARAAEAINARSPDLVLAGGDLITDGFQSAAAVVEPRWDVYMEMHRAIRAPVYPVLGNHDLVAALPEDGTAASRDPRAIFRQRFGLERTYYAFDAGHHRFFVLDSVQVVGGEEKYEGRISEEQIDWLRRELLGLETSRPLVLATHIPLRTAFFQATEGATAAAPRSRVVVNSKEVLDLFADRRLVLVLQGHMHVHESLRWRETTFVTGGALSGRWWRGPWQGTEEGFVVVTLDGGRVDVEYVDYGWDARRPPGV
jgi:3',5'-cyclic AMP phosphodiesterase CpdA